MKNYPRLLIKKIFHKLNLVAAYNLLKNGPLHDDGWFRSVREARSVDSKGNPIIWINYPAIDFLNRRINDKMTVFEYGSGASTLWWAKKVKTVISCEHDERWYLSLRDNIPRNVNLYFVPLSNKDHKYEEKINEFRGLIDIAVIDGRNRNRCAINAMASIKSDGIIIWDNSDLKEYEPGQQELKRNGFKKIEFVGIPPGNNTKTETSIFYQDNNCFNI